MSGLTPIDREVARALMDCAVDGGSGVLTAVRGKLKRIFCLGDGRLTFGQSNVIEEQLSESLVRHGLLTPADYVDAMVRSRESEVKLSRFLVDEGVVAEEELLQALEQHLRYLLFSTLDWPDGHVQLSRGTPNLTGEVTHQLPCARLLLDYARHHPPTLDEVRIKAAQPQSRPVVDADRLSLLGDGDPDSVTRHLLERCDGGADVEAIVLGSPESEETTWRALYGLSLIGLVRSEIAASDEPEAPDAVTREELLARLQSAEGADYYAVLELNASCTPEQIREAYYFLARRYHPDRFRTGNLQDMLQSIETYFTRVTEAYNTLFDTSLRREYDQQRAGAGASAQEPEQDTGQLARQNFLRARALIQRGRLTDAVTWLENAIQLAPQQATYHLELGRLLSRNPRLRPKAEQHLLEANRLDPTMPDGYVALGELYLKVDREDEAVRLFREALRWEPDHEPAAAQLRALGESVDA